MLGSAMLDVAIGIVVIFSFLAMIVTTLRESIESVVKSRSRTLERAIREMLGDRGAERVYCHPLVNGLYRGSYKAPPYDEKARSRAWLRRHLERAVWRGRPSYIPSRTFALSLLDSVAREQNGTDTPQRPGGISVMSIASTRRSIAARLPAANQDSASLADRAVLTAIDASQLDPNRTVAELEAWYDGAMDRASGRYKRATQLIVFCLSLAIVLAFNVNAVELSQRLYRDPGVRNALVARAGTNALGPAPAGAAGVSPAAASIPSTESLHDLRTQLEALQLPLGYPDSVSDLGSWSRATRRGWLGLLISTFAISLGSPFWFDVLNKLMVIRATVKPREKSQEAGSEDRKGGSGTGGQDPLLTTGPSPVGSVPAGFPPQQTPNTTGPRGTLI